MKQVDEQVYSVQAPSHIKPEAIDLDHLPSLQKPQKAVEPTANTGAGKPTSPETEPLNIRTSEVLNFGTYDVPHFEQMLRFDCRLTKAQKLYLDQLENTIRYQKPEGEQGDRENRRITKTSIVRVYIELFRRLDIKLSPENYANEADLLQDILEKLKEHLCQP